MTSLAQKLWDASRTETEISVDHKAKAIVVLNDRALLPATLEEVEKLLESLEHLQTVQYDVCTGEIFPIVEFDSVEQAARWAREYTDDYYANWRNRYHWAPLAVSEQSLNAPGQWVRVNF